MFFAVVVLAVGWSARSPAPPERQLAGLAAVCPGARAMVSLPPFVALPARTRTALALVMNTVADEGKTPAYSCVELLAAA